MKLSISPEKMSPHYLVKMDNFDRSVHNTVHRYWVKNAFSISQGSAVTFFRWGWQLQNLYVEFTQDFVYQKLLKSVHFRLSYLKMKRGTFFWTTLVALVLIVSKSHSLQLCLTAQHGYLQLIPLKHLWSYHLMALYKCEYLFHLFLMYVNRS